MDGVHQGGDEQEGEFQGLRDARQHGGDGGGDQQAAGDFALLGLGGLVHGQGRAGEAEDHEGELARHEAGGGDGEHLRRLGGQLRKKDVLGPLDGHAVHDGRAAQGRLPEGHIEDMVQAEGDQRPLQDAVNPGARVAGADHQVAQGRDAHLDDGPDVEHGDAHHYEDGGADDGHEAGAAEEGQHLGQLDLVEAVVQRRHAQAHDDAAEDAHL